MGSRTAGSRIAFPMAALMGLGVLSGCAGGAPSAPPPDGGPAPSTTQETGPVPPSIARDVPAEKRTRLGALSSEQLCGLVTPEVLGRLAFPVQAGQPREVDADPPVRGCSFAADSGDRSVLISAQPEGFVEVGVDEVDLGELRGSRTLHGTDCTVFAGVSGATLQVSVTAADAGSEQCDTAAAVAGYVAEGLVR
ncbi:DUF3558 domain-containing protein [Haloactinomyces albus]|uniref:DUF3558 domain-containing protein n=1 Tax=Haloactinomyces albus TaxID=1352928 RepID=A0AAE4CLL5_9ACTN|nr:DUF3558 domain-containing protein [Haloactinomyces albus]MDR7302380.1 hypothetical protein [Haloactinomyces albus]